MLRINNNKLTTAFVETIAGQWRRMNIETAEAAMKTAEKEHKKTKTKVQTKVKKEEITPIWFNKENNADEIDAKQKEEIEQMLKEI